MTTIKRVVAIMMFAVLVTVSAFAQTQQMDVSPSVMTFTYQMGSSFPPSQVWLSAGIRENLQMSMIQ
jgi:hypothetical protein